MKPINLKDSRHFYIHTDMTEDFFHVNITDLRSLWKEVKSKSDLLFDFKKLNPLIDSNDDQILERIDSMLAGGDGFDVVQNESGMDLSVTKKHGPISIKLKFALLKCPIEDFYTGVTLPLILLVNQLSEQQKQLCTLLKGKDLELREYKLEGADISRDNVKTGEFDESAFQANCIEAVSKISIETVESKLNFSEGISKLYKETCRKVNKAKVPKIKEEPLLEVLESCAPTENITAEVVIKNENIKQEDNKRQITSNFNVQRTKKRKKNMFL